jgi:phosphoribosylanthranilate isomerase
MIELTQRTRIKICGIRDPEMGRFAIDAGADAIGLMFYAPSARAVEVADAKRIVAALPSGALSVAVFVNAAADYVREVMREVKPSLLQFHGDEDAAFCTQFGCPYWKAIRVSAKTDLLKLQRGFASADRLLLDSDVVAPTQGQGDAAKHYGGTGQVFDWSAVPEAMASGIVLSGGLTVKNIGAAIRRLHPWAVDVSSGVEVSRGVKSTAQIEQFIAAVKEEDRRGNAL